MKYSYYIYIFTSKYIYKYKYIYIYVLRNISTNINIYICTCLHVYHIEHCYVRWFWQSYLIADCIVRGHKVSSQTSVPVQRKEAATISTISCALSARGAGNALCEVLGKFIIYIYIRIYIDYIYTISLGVRRFFGAGY